MRMPAQLLDAVDELVTQHPVMNRQDVIRTALALGVEELRRRYSAPTSTRGARRPATSRDGSR